MRLLLGGVLKNNLVRLKPGFSLHDLPREVGNKARLGLGILDCRCHLRFSAGSLLGLAGPPFGKVTHCADTASLLAPSDGAGEGGSVGTLGVMTLAGGNGGIHDTLLHETLPPRSGNGKAGRESWLVRGNFTPNKQKRKKKDGIMESCNNVTRGRRSQCRRWRPAGDYVHHRSSRNPRLP